MTKPTSASFNRRDFLKTGSLGALGVLFNGLEATPLAAAGYEPAQRVFDGPPVACAVIGTGLWGRELIGFLDRTPGASLHTVCDHYPAFLRRGAALAPQAKAVEDYRRVVEDAEVDAVFVATPTHQHREITVAALEAGKHVYCEAPLAHTVADARAIAAAAKAAAPAKLFQAGLQMRSEPQNHHVMTFVRTGALGSLAMARSQVHRKESWRRPAPNREREEVVNWRLNREISTGLLGEWGIHHLDTVRWLAGGRPKAVSAFGGVTQWHDGRDVADTTQAVFEFPNEIAYNLSCSLANSFEGSYDVIFGGDSAILLRGTQAWMFREADAPLLGWEVYARRDQFLNDTGISLVADATQLLAQGIDPATHAAEAESPVFHAVSDFIAAIHDGEPPAAGYAEGFEATVLALKANEALLTGKRVELRDEWFNLS